MCSKFCLTYLAYIGVPLFIIFMGTGLGLMIPNIISYKQEIKDKHFVETNCDLLEISLPYQKAKGRYYYFNVYVSYLVKETDEIRNYNITMGKYARIRYAEKAREKYMGLKETTCYYEPNYLTEEEEVRLTKPNPNKNMAIFTVGAFFTFLAVSVVIYMILYFTVIKGYAEYDTPEVSGTVVNDIYNTLDDPNQCELDLIRNNSYS